MKRVVGQPMRPAIDWRRNLLWLWVVSALTQFGVYAATPFLPLLIQSELGVHDSRQVALWVGATGSAIGVGLIVTGPVWGRIADRYSRKSMVLRATGIGGLLVAACAFAQTPLQLVGVRLMAGSVAGNQSAISALVASETPELSVGWALGVIGSATAVGRALGPLVGSLLIGLIGLRYQFVFAGLAMVAATLPLTYSVHETDRRTDSSRRLSLWQLLRSTPTSSLRMAGLLLVAQAVAMVVNYTSVQFTGLRVIETAANDPGLVTGLAFATQGACTAVGSLGYSRIVALIGYRPVAATAILLLGSSVSAIALGSTSSQLVVAAGAQGIAFGACLPALSSMIGLETPEPLRATMFGFGSSLVGVGFAAMPIVAGILAAALSTRFALIATAASAILVGAAVLAFGREPLLIRPGDDASSDPPPSAPAESPRYAGPTSGGD